MGNNPATEAYAQAFADHLRTRFPALAYAIEAGERIRDNSDLLNFCADVNNGNTFDVFQQFERALSHFKDSCDAQGIDLAQANAEVENLRNDLRSTQDNLLATQARLDETRNSAAGSVRRRTNDPKPFSGEEKDVAKRQQDFINWWAQLRRIWVTDSPVFHNEFQKLQHLAGLLEGEAMELYHDDFEKITDNPRDSTKWTWLPDLVAGTTSIDACYKSFSRQYVTLDLSQLASRQFDDCFMNDRPFQNFNAELACFGAKCGKTTEQMTDALHLRVSHQLAQMVTTLVDRPDKGDYRAWTTLYQKFYDNLVNQKHVNKLRSQRNETNTQNKDKNKNKQQQNNQNNQQQNPQHTHHHAAQAVAGAGDPMDLSRAQLGPDECGYCHEIGHWKKDCAIKKANDARYAGMPSTGGRGRGSGGRGGRGGGIGANGGGRGVPPQYSQYQQYPQYNQHPPQYPPQQPRYGSQPQVPFNNTRGAPPQQLRQLDTAPAALAPWEQQNESDTWTINGTDDLNQPPPVPAQATLPARPGTTMRTDDSANWQYPRLGNA